MVRRMIVIVCAAVRAVAGLTEPAQAASTARGYGLGYGYKPGGGYYRKQVRTQFKAEKIGRCSAD